MDLAPVTDHTPLVLLVGYTDSRSMGGSLRVLESLAKSLPAQGFNVEIAFAYGDGGAVSMVCNCPVHLIRASSPYDLRAWLRVRALIKDRQPSIIQFVDNVYWMMIAAHGSPVIKLAYAHGCVIFQRSRLKKSLMSRLLPIFSRGIVAISYGAKRSLIQQGLWTSDRCWVVQNGIDPRFMIASNPPDTRHSGQQVDRIILGMACLLTEHKGIFDALRLMQLLPENWHLVVAGKGPHEVQFRQLIDSSGLMARVTLLGHCEDMETFYRSIDFYLFLSRYESFGLVLAEAMSIGVPVVGFRADGEYAESEYPLIDDTVALMLLREDPFDYDHGPGESELQKLADQIVDLEANRVRLNTQVENARNRIDRGFLATHQASRLAKVYRQLLGGRDHL